MNAPATARKVAGTVRVSKAVIVLLLAALCLAVFVSDARAQQSMHQDLPTWTDTAILYQITPHSFTKNGFEGITRRLPELRSLGVNTLYLQPVYETFGGGQGYDVIDFFSVRPDLGTERELRSLITTAKELGFRVIFDFVPNHTSIHHPYARSVKQLGTASPYYDYYQHNFDGAMYASHYNKDSANFVYYFWKDLVNLNYNSEEVQRWMIEASKYWVREFDIDGYRFDAVWGVNARNPSFGKRLRRELKRIKPEVFLLAEDKPWPDIGERGFDAAYDWTMDTSWVSQWSWAYEYHERESLTIFNFPETNKRAEMLWQAIANVQNSDRPVLRFMENNDLPRFAVHHSLAQVKMVAALLFALPGIPMLYNGQEVGVRSHPYSRHTIFIDPRQPIRSSNPTLFDYYRNLIQLRQKFPALRGEFISAVPVSPSGALLALHRWEGGEHCLVVVNLGDSAVDAVLNLSGVFPAAPASLEDLITGEKTGTAAADGHVRIRLAPFSTRLFRADFN